MRWSRISGEWSLVEAVREGRYKDALLALASSWEFDKWERDYAQEHLRDVFGDSLPKRLSWAEKADKVLDAPRLSSCFSGLPHLVLLRFTCDCAVRALVREENEGRDVNPVLWDAIATQLAWSRGLAAREEVDAAYDAARVEAYLREEMVSALLATSIDRFSETFAAQEARRSAAHVVQWASVYRPYTEEDPEEWYGSACSIAKQASEAAYWTETHSLVAKSCQDGGCEVDLQRIALVDLLLRWAITTSEVHLDG